ncbi:hypothetical protein MNBD_ALPHA06-251 [hydrothermal vent metagenome]|uniref:Uncharacterized protein n=1 Tax=hydrothermal vent metagenome TaxID=652676 RepID=A0A3B0RHQ3_9ZZZZ
MAKKPTKAKATASKPAPDEQIHPAAKPFLWLGSHKVQRGFIWLVGGLMLIFMALDFVAHRHSYFALEKTMGFYAIAGFVAFTFVVLMGWPLRKLTGRPENYYGDDGEDGDE